MSKENKYGIQPGIKPFPYEMGVTASAICRTVPNFVEVNQLGDIYRVADCRQGFEADRFSSFRDALNRASLLSERQRYDGSHTPLPLLYVFTKDSISQYCIFMPTVDNLTELLLMEG